MTIAHDNDDDDDCKRWKHCFAVQCLGGKSWGWFVEPGRWQLQEGSSSLC